MATDLKKKFAARLRQVIGKQPVIDLGERGGPSRSYIYRMLKGEANVSLEELDAVLRAYGSTLGEFFEPWREDERVQRQKLAAEARGLIEDVISGDGDLGGLVRFLHALSPDAKHRRNKAR